MSSTIYKSNFILIVLCIGMTLIHYSSQGKGDKANEEKKTGYVNGLVSKILPTFLGGSNKSGDNEVKSENKRTKQKPTREFKHPAYSNDYAAAVIIAERQIQNYL